MAGFRAGNTCDGADNLTEQTNTLRFTIQAMSLIMRQTILLAGNCGLDTL
jgi:hypothetical protein